MATPKWQPGKLYPNGSIVVPRTNPPGGASTLQNPGWETGDATGWDITIVSSSGSVFLGVRNKDPRTGVYIYAMDASGGDAVVEGLNQEVAAVVPGQIVTGRMSIRRSGAATASAKVFLRWYDIGGIEIITSESATYTQPEAWISAQVSAVAPAGAVSVRFGFWGSVSSDGDFRFDDATWNATVSVTGLLFKAVQPAAGYSDSTEPVWPTVNGVQVVDHEVIWEAFYGSRVVWKAFPILKSGAVEPVWPTDVGERVPDNTIAWELVSRHITDPKCPNSKIVVIDQGKVYMGDKDIVAFCATNNPLDWHKEEDAGYLPFGLGAYGDNPISAMGLYRGNLMVFNSKAFQLWQIDPDPALNNRIDTIPIGSIYHRAFQSVGNDSFFLAALGVRTVGIAASSTNIKSGDVGMPVDPMVQAMLRLGMVPISLYNPSAGQYWLIFRIPGVGETPPSSVVFVHTSTQIGSVGAWSRYLFPFRIDYFGFDGDVLVLRAGNRVLESEEYMDRDLIGDPDEAEIESTLEWNYLECGGALGQDKEMEGFDLVSTAEVGFEPQVSFGWDQRDRNKFTPPVTVPADSVPDYMIPLELTAPSIAARIVYTGRKWQFSAMNLYLQGRSLAR